MWVSVKNSVTFLNSKITKLFSFKNLNLDKIVQANDNQYLSRKNNYFHY